VRERGGKEKRLGRNTGTVLPTLQDPLKLNFAVKKMVSFMYKVRSDWKKAELATLHRSKLKVRGDFNVLINC